MAPVGSLSDRGSRTRLRTEGRAPFSVSVTWIRVVCAMAAGGVLFLISGADAPKPSLTVKVASVASVWLGSDASQRWDIRDKTGRLIDAYLFPVTLAVVLENASTETIELYEEANSWGYANLEFEVVAGGTTTRLAKKDEGTWYRNMPMTVRLPPGGVLVIPVVLVSAIWAGLEKAALRQPDSKIRAIYKEKAKRKGVWSGQEFSPWYEIREFFPGAFSERQNVLPSSPHYEPDVPL